MHARRHNGSRRSARGGPAARAILALWIAGCAAEPEDPFGALGPGGTPAAPGVDGVAGGGIGGHDARPTDGASGPMGSPVPADCTAIPDACPAPGGAVAWACRKRFLYGVNYAWSREGRGFAADFGGIAGWNVKGVSGEPEPIRRELADMRAHGADVIRWWMFPALRGEGLSLDAAGDPRLGASVVADVEAALALAAEAGVHVKLTVFSFDDFEKPKALDGGLRQASLSPVVRDPDKRRRLVETVVRPVARAVQQSPHAGRMVAWDVINEPEWAIQGSDPYGDMPFDPQGNMDTVTFAEMETFVKEVVAGLRAESRAPITVGAAAFKWSCAWQKVGLDFYTFHYYDWVHQHFPYTRSLADYGVGDKPVVMGEFPLSGVTGVPYARFVADLFDRGYAGAQGWAFSDRMWPWAQHRGAVKDFADAKGCVVRY